MKKIKYSGFMIFILMLLSVTFLGCTRNQSGPLDVSTNPPEETPVDIPLDTPTVVETNVTADDINTLASEPDPAIPSSIQKITLSRSELVVHRSEKVRLKIGVYNPSTFVATEITPDITCRGNVVVDPIRTTHDIAALSYRIYAYDFTVNSIIEPGTYICTVKLNGRISFLSTDFVIQVN